VVNYQKCIGREPFIFADFSQPEKGRAGWVNVLVTGLIAADVLLPRLRVAAAVPKWHRRCRSADDLSRRHVAAAVLNGIIAATLLMRCRCAAALNGSPLPHCCCAAAA
jgi:hypothetical protein